MSPARDVNISSQFPITSDRRPTPAKKTPPVLVSNTQQSRQENTSMSDPAPIHQSPSVRLVSFGYLHGQPPAADLVVDVRELLRDPARARDGGFLDLDGRHPAVRDAVLTTPGAAQLVEAIYVMAFDLCTNTAKSVTVAFGCAGGRHRSVALAEEVAARLSAGTWGYEIPVGVAHLHIHLPRVLRANDNDQGGQR
ncbi:hypothetical protein GCM10029964_115800 [Kibdelosporangium lantanae]